MCLSRGLARSLAASTTTNSTYRNKTWSCAEISSVWSMLSHFCVSSLQEFMRMHDDKMQHERHRVSNSYMEFGGTFSITANCWILQMRIQGIPPFHVQERKRLSLEQAYISYDLTRGTPIGIGESETLPPLSVQRAHSRDGPNGSAFSSRTQPIESTVSAAKRKETIQWRHRTINRSTDRHMLAPTHDPYIWKRKKESWTVSDGKAGMPAWHTRRHYYARSWGSARMPDSLHALAS
jgi:hypothetical protein